MQPSRHAIAPPNYCRCGKEYRPISKTTLVYRCLTCGGLRAYVPPKVPA